MFQELPASDKSLAARRLVFGVGVNDSEYKTTIIVSGKPAYCPFYVKWTSMLQRCYSVKCQERQPTYKNCTVCDEWLLFSAFKLWLTGQEWEGKQIDKDLLTNGNKIYSPETCLLVSSAINSLLLDCKSSRGDLPVGVSFHKKARKYESNVSYNGKKKYLGLFGTPELAHQAYKSAKYAIIKEVAEKQPEPLRSALLKYKIK